MTKTSWIMIGTGVYVAVFIGLVAAFAVWKIRRRKERPPVEFKLLRGPGESLRRRLAKADENDVFHVIGAGFLPLAAACAPLSLMSAFKPTTWTQLNLWLVATGAVFVGASVLAARHILARFGRYRNDRLGYLGERAVGEGLLPLIECGYRVFHDVPAVAGGKPFNVDHVAVGPNGVFAIETKTRRKGRARPGFDDYKVAYDGKRLIWPWTEDDFGLQQAESRARWLSQWLTQITGMAIAARPFLVLPGWYVVPKGLGPVTVISHKQLATSILRAAPTPLDTKQIDLIARQLDQRCRDVDE